jgi:hypothetical protein
MKNRIEKLKGHADILLNAYLGLREKLEVLKPIIFDEPTARLHRVKRRARGFLVIRRSLFESCVLDVHALAFDNDARTPSVHGFVKALQEDSLRALLRNSQRRAAVFDKKCKRILEEWNSFKAQPWAQAFRELRDQRIAHLEVKKSGNQYKRLDVSSLGLKWNDIEESVDLLERLVLDLMGVVRDEGYDLGNIKQTLENDGKAFWA